MHEGNSLKFSGSMEYMIMNQLGFIGQRSRSPQDQMWTKIQLWGHNSTQMYRAATFIHGQDYLGSVKHFLKFEVQRSRSPHEKPGEKNKFLSHNSILI